MAGAVFGNVIMEGVTPLFRDNIYNYARSLARVSGFTRQVRINGRSVQEDDDERVHNIVNVDEDMDEATSGTAAIGCRAQFTIINKPNDDDDDSNGSSDCAKLVIDVSSDGEPEAPANSPISSVGGSPAVTNWPTGDGVFSPFLLVSAPHSPKSSMSTDCYTIEEEFARLGELDIEVLEKEIVELCVEKGHSPCISLAAPSEPVSWLEPVTTPASESAGTGACPRDAVAATLNHHEDPRQEQYLMTLLDARGQLPTCKRDVPQSMLTRADFGIAGAISFDEAGVLQWFERAHRPMAPGTSR